MAKFKDALSSLGYFWPQDKPANRWPGILSIETFPRARLHCTAVWLMAGKRPAQKSKCSLGHSLFRPTNNRLLRFQ
jgi:hypothetical protein